MTNQRQPIARIGILMLQTKFPRIVGDVGNPRSFDFPVQYSVVDGATPKAIVQGDVTDWIAAFVDAGRTLVAQGCAGLGTTCGFLTPVRAHVAAACGVPVVSSALDLVPGLLAKGATPGILTISARSLGPAHLGAAGVPDQTTVVGLDNSSFARSILGNRPTLDTARAETEMVAAARNLCSTAPATDVIVLECTNMPPYGDAITATTGRPVVSILTGLNALHDDLRASRDQA